MGYIIDERVERKIVVDFAEELSDEIDDPVGKEDGREC